MHLNPWHILAIAMAGWMNREQNAVIEYLKEENSVLRELLDDKQPRLNDDQRCRLAAKDSRACPDAGLQEVFRLGQNCLIRLGPPSWP